MTSLNKPSKPTRFYWGAEINAWRVYGVWIRQKYFIGWSVTLEEY